MMPKPVVDDRLITGQNPYSTTAVAEAIVRATGRTPVARTPWRDERTMPLAQRRLAGDADTAAPWPATLLAVVTGVLPLAFMAGIALAIRRWRLPSARRDALALAAALQCMLVLAGWGMLPFRLWH